MSEAAQSQPGLSLPANFAQASEEELDAAIIRLGAAGEPAFPLIKELLDSPDPDRRWWGVRALAAAPNPQPGKPDWAGGRLVLALADSDVSVCQCSALGLRQRKTGLASEQSVAALIPALSSPDPLLRRLAGDALGEAGSAAVPVLLEAFQQGPLEGRGQAARALALIGDMRAIPALFKALDDPSTFVAYWANEGLDRMGVGMMFFNPSS